MTFSINGVVSKVNGVVLTFDFGGTKLTSALVTPHNGQIIAQLQEQTPVVEGANSSLALIVESGRKILGQNSDQARRMSAIGISFGGPINQDRRSILRSNHVQNWDGANLPDILSREFGVPAFMDNDANLAALGEYTFGAARGADSLIYIQISTGIGAGIILDRQIHHGQGLAGEFGHITILIGGPECTCGKRGCLESVSAGWAIARDGKSLLRNLPPNHLLWSLCEDNPEKLTAEMIFQAARRGDAEAYAIVHRAIAFLGIGIASAVCILHPQVVLVGGGITNSWDMIHPILEKSVEESLPPSMRGTIQLKHGKLEGLETILGASILPQIDSPRP